MGFSRFGCFQIWCLSFCHEGHSLCPSLPISESRINMKHLSNYTLNSRQRFSLLHFGWTSFQDLCQSIYLIRRLILKRGKMSLGEWFDGIWFIFNDSERDRRFKHYDLTVSWPSCYLTKELLDKSKPVSDFCVWYLILHDPKFLLCLCSMWQDPATVAHLLVIQHPKSIRSPVLLHH